ncbi:MAG: rRNA maturation RNase YbeY [Bacteroidales bacterium]|nr:rRNA maturation RNase YbeY [Bacteroidales bacterium]
MAITFSYQIDNFRLPDAERVRRWICKVIVEPSLQAIVAEYRVGSIGYLFCDDTYLLEANQKYLNHDTYTDIITFDYVEGGLVSGDIMISVDRVGENASLFGVSFEQELHRVIIHGILHLLGQADKSEPEAAEMRNKENRALKIWETMK